MVDGSFIWPYLPGKRVPLERWSPWLRPDQVTMDHFFGGVETSIAG